MKYLKLDKKFLQIQQAFNNNQRIVLKYNNSIIGELINLNQQTNTRSQQISRNTVNFQLINFIANYPFNNYPFFETVYFYTLDEADIEEAAENEGIIIPNWEEGNLYNVELLNDIETGE